MAQIIIDLEEIKALIPHRSPFLFVDRIIEFSESGGIGEKTFAAEEVFFQGHFPGNPLVPGIFLQEALAQTGGAIARLVFGRKNDSLYVLTEMMGRFRTQVHPDELCRLVVENVKVRERYIRQSGNVVVRGSVAVTADWLCMLST